MIVCRQCGERAREGVEFCESCGAFLEWEGEHLDQPGPPTGTSPGGPVTAPTPPVGTPPAPAAPAGPSPVPQPSPGPLPAAGIPAGPPPAPAPVPAPAAPAAPAGRGGSIRCLECGATQSGDRRFCKRCGGALDLVALAGPQVPGPAVAPAGPQVPGPAVAPARPPGGAPPPAGGIVPVPPVAPAGPVARTPAERVPDAPRLATRAVPPAESQGTQPAEAPLRPPPVRPQVTQTAIEPGGELCQQCGSSNPPGRRFCRKCGAGLAAVALDAGPVVTEAPRPSLWQRLTGRARSRDGTGSDREGGVPSRTARAAYRRSLDVRFRVMRVLALVAGVGIMAGSLGLVGVNPIRGARGLWDKYFPRYEAIGELQAAADPPQAVDPDFPPGFAVDRDPQSAWAAQWRTPDDADPPEACPEEPSGGGADAALIITLPEPTAVGKISVQANLPADTPSRAGFHQPTRLEVRFDDGTCEKVELADKAGFQSHRIDGPQTSTVRIAVIDARPPRDQALSQEQVAIGEIRLYRQK
ncbi:MAG TPA: zinc ribbon domain-containing protein [Acidimicrobiales bacterium]|nr:zinc ribbon domain-containing protein [Acidimicrobiales bacterium]